LLIELNKSNISVDATNAPILFSIDVGGFLSSSNVSRGMGEAPGWRALLLELCQVVPVDSKAVLQGAEAANRMGCRRCQADLPVVITG
jgi:hypothetical protein